MYTVGLYVYRRKEGGPVALRRPGIGGKLPHTPSFPRRRPRCGAESRPHHGTSQGGNIGRAFSPKFGASTRPGAMPQAGMGPGRCPSNPCGFRRTEDQSCSAPTAHPHTSLGQRPSGLSDFEIGSVWQRHLNHQDGAHNDEPSVCHPKQMG